MGGNHANLCDNNIPYINHMGEKASTQALPEAKTAPGTSAPARTKWCHHPLVYYFNPMLLDHRGQTQRDQNMCENQEP